MALALCLTLLPTAALAAEGHTHCICGKTTHVNIGDHTEEHQITCDKWLASFYGELAVQKSSSNSSREMLTGDDNYVTLTAGYYYLSNTVSGCDDVGYVRSLKTIKIDGDVTICLNGTQIQKVGNTTGSVFEVPSGSTLTLTDCKGNGQVMCDGNSHGSGVYVNGGILNLYSGQIANSKGQTGTDYNQYGGGVYVNGGTFNMYGGVITGNSANYGGGVYVKSGTFNMNGGTIENNTSSGGYGTLSFGGAGVYVEASGKFIMNNDASVTANTIGSGSNGGGVYVKSGTFEMNGNASVTDNKAARGNTLSGGGVYVEGGTFTMNGEAKVMRNAASGTKKIDGNGGGVYVKSGTFTMNGSASVSDNTATNSDSRNTTYGGGVYVNDGTFTMNGEATSVSNNTATNGGGVYASGGEFNMNGNASIKSNIGNGVCVHETATFTVSGAPTVTENTMEGAASNVYLEGSKTITIGGKLDEDASIGVSKKYLNKGDAIATGATEDYSSNFSIDDTQQYVVKYDEPNSQLVLAKVETPTPDHTHSYNEKTWKMDATYHWHECTASDCTDKPGSIKDRAEHVYENASDTTCKVCGYVRTVTTENIPVTSITLNKTETSISVGKSEKLTATVTPSSATNPSVTWKSSKTEVATVANDGTVTAKAPGTATITVKATDDSGKSATCTVTVTGGTTPSQPGGSTGGSTGGGSSSGGSSSGGSGSSDSNPVIKTETKNNSDGSTTKTETRKDGSVTATTTGKDGSVSKTETKKDGSSVTENKAADGSTGTVKTDKNGQTEASAKLSAKAVEDAKKSGEPVKAPVEVEASRNSGTAPTVKVELPKSAGKTEVEIPVSNAKPGTVAVLVHADGTEEILKASVPTEGGIRLTVDGSATVKIVDNSKDFIDTRNHWAKDAIDFVSARELVNGMSDSIYAPDNSTTRAQLWTILARQNDADLNGGNTWYEKAQLWSQNKGISDGTNPNGTINRAQMVTMMWRTAGQPTAGGTANFTDVPADSYYAQAVAWAVENDITDGVGNGRFDPAATCTRAQIATFLARSMK